MHSVEGKRPLAALLEALAKENRPLNKYELQKKACVATQSVYDWIPQMERDGLIKVHDVKKSRVGLEVKYYELTDEGLVAASGMATDSVAQSNIRRRLGGKLGTYQERAAEFRKRDAQRWSELIRQVLASGKAAPGWRLRLEIRANGEGAIRMRAQVGFPRHKRVKASREP